MEYLQKKVGWPNVRIKSDLDLKIASLSLTATAVVVTVGRNNLKSKTIDNIGSTIIF